MHSTAKATPRPLRWQPRSLIVLILLASTCNSFAFWNITAKRTLREADRHMEQARTAEDEQRILEACEAYSHAYELYQEVQRKSPSTRTEHVLRQSAECRARIRTLFARAGSMSDPLPSPDEILPLAEGKTENIAMTEEPDPTEVASRTSDVSPPPQPSSEEPRPDDVPEDLPQTTPPPAPPPAPSRDMPKRTWLGRIFSGKSEDDKADPDIPDGSTSEGRVVESARQEETIDGSSRLPSATKTISDKELYSTVQTMLRRGEGADAVLLLDEIIEKGAGKATFTQRLLFAQALIDRRNYDRAHNLLDDLHLEDPTNPSIKTMLAGVHMAQGRPIAALRLMDEMVRDYPRYADAYVNLAYIRFAMNPHENRDEALLYYRHALTLGAARDSRLELELKVDVNP